MSKIRESAKGEECTARLWEVCNHNSETVVLCHVRMHPFSGMGLKPPDWLAFYGCANCHAAIDGRLKVAQSQPELRLAAFEAVIRTQAKLIEKGLLKVTK